MLARREQNLLISLPEYNKEKVVLCYDLLQIKQSSGTEMFFFLNQLNSFMLSNTFEEFLKVSICCCK